MSHDLKNQIDKLTNQLAAKKAQLLMKEQAAKNKKLVLTRRQRDKNIYKLGGMVEKMGLDRLDDEFFLGMLYMLNQNASKPAWQEKFMEWGKPYMVVGKKMPRPNLDEAKATDQAQNQEGQQ